MPTHTSFREIRRKFDQIFIKLKSWRKYYICLCRGAAVTTGFAYTQRLVDQAAVGFLIIYFSNSWEKNKLSNAVAMINVLEGLSSILVPAMTYISENHVSPLKVILYSNAAYITGMVMLCISAFHPIPGDMTGMYFVPVVLLIAVGKAGGLPILEEFLVGQLADHEPRELDKGRVYARKTVWWFTAWLLCTLSTPFFFGNAGWHVTFICSTSVMGIGCLLFWYCIPLYHRSVDEAATTSEISRDVSEENTNNVPTPAVSAGRRLKEQLKPLSVMIPMWTTFLVFGLVLSTRETLFAEDGNMMERTENPTVLIYVVDMIGMIIRATSSFFTAILLKYVPKRLNTLHIIVGIWIAMVLSVFCCSVAWSVEFRRLCAIEDPGMNIMQLATPYCLLGLMEGIGKQGLDLFFEVQVSGVPLEKYGSDLNEAMIGFGSFINALLVFCLRSWFSDTLEDSIHLDNYYKMLMILSFVNLCYYSWLVPIYYFNKKQTKDDPDKIHGAVELITIGAKSRILTRANQISRRRGRDQDNTYLLLKD